MTEPRAMRYLRGLGWAALAAAPILLGTLALLSGRPDLPSELTMHAMIASWIAGSLAFAAALLAVRNARLARVPMAMSALAVIGFCAFLVWVSANTPVGLSEEENVALVTRGDRLAHPALGFSILAPGLDPAPDIAREMSARGGDVWARAHRLWAWRGAETEIVLDLSRTARADRAALEDGIDEIAGPLDHPQIHRDRLSCDVEAELPGAGHAIARLALIERGGHAYRVSITIVTNEAERWRAWLRQAQLRTR